MKYHLTECDKCNNTEKHENYHPKGFIEVELKIKYNENTYAYEKKTLTLCPICLEKIGIKMKDDEIENVESTKDRLYDIIRDILEEMREE